MTIGKTHPCLEISWNFPESVQIEHKHGHSGNFHEPHYDINDEDISFQVAHAQTYSFFKVKKMSNAR